MANFTHQITDTKDVFKKLGINNTTLTSTQNYFKRKRLFNFTTNKFIRENLKQLNKITSDLIKSEEEKKEDGKEKKKL